MVLEGAGFLGLAMRLSKKLSIIEADADEIKREDDVLLGATPFLLAILLFYVNALFQDTTIKISFSALVVLPTACFYLFRAWAKIKSNPEYRFYSVFLLTWSACSYAFMLIVVFLPIIFPPVLNLVTNLQVAIIACLTSISILPTAIVSVYFPKRYGLKRLKSRKNQ